MRRFVRRAPTARQEMNLLGRRRRSISGGGGGDDGSSTRKGKEEDAAETVEGMTATRSTDLAKRRSKGEGGGPENGQRRRKENGRASKGTSPEEKQRQPTAVERFEELQARIPLESLVDARDGGRTLSFLLHDAFGSTGDVSDRIEIVDNAVLVLKLPPGAAAATAADATTTTTTSSGEEQQTGTIAVETDRLRLPLDELIAKPPSVYERALYELGYATPAQRARAAKWKDSTVEWRWAVETDAVTRRIEPWRVYISIRRWKPHEYFVPSSETDAAAASSSSGGFSDEITTQPGSIAYAKVRVARLFPQLPEGSEFGGHRMAQLFVTTATREQREFAGLFAKTARVYVTTLLRLPFRLPSARSGKGGGGEGWTHRTVDFRTADPGVLAAALAAEGRGGCDPDALLYAMAAHRAELGSDAQGLHLYVPLLPEPPDIGLVPARLDASDLDAYRGVRVGNTVVAERPLPGVQNWQLEFATLTRGRRGGRAWVGGAARRGGGEAETTTTESARRRRRPPPQAVPPFVASRIVLDFSTLNFWTQREAMQPQKVSKLMRGVFPVAYAQNLERTAYLKGVYNWRMRWRYAAKPIVYCQGRERGAVTALTLPPWH